jgi:uncharacterized sulfatase
LKPTPPHLLLIVLDTLRRDRLGAYGALRSGASVSPVFDQFAAEGTRYARAVAPAQWTVPAHASLFTGRYPSEHGVTQSSSRLSETIPTAAEHLRAAGYHTVAFCNNPLVGVLEHGLQRGFDHFFNYASAVPYTPRDLVRSGPRRAFSRWFRPHARRIGNQFAQSDTMFRLALQPLFVPVWSKYINFKGNTAASLADLAAYLTGPARRDGRPWFAFVNLMSAHLPYQPPQTFLDRIDPALRRDKAAFAFMRRFNADGAAWASPPEPPLSPWERDILLAFYDAEIAFQDEQLALLFNSLRAADLLAQTTTVILADHGEGHGEHDLFGHGFSAYGELVHVPMAVQGERFGRGIVVDTPVSTRRIFHTLLDLAGASDHDATDDPAIAALSLAAPRAEAAEPAALSESFAVNTFLHVLEHRNPSVIARMRLRETRRAVYAGEHKLLVRETAGHTTTEALFDTAADPAETRDLLTRQPATVDALMGCLNVLMAAHAAAAPMATTAAPADDPRVLENLRALGYIE